MSQAFPYRNLRHYLEFRGLLNASADELQKAKKTYLQLYQRHYRQNSDKHQMNVLLNGIDFGHVKEKAKVYNLSRPTQYVVHLIRADREGVETRPNLLVDIEIGILKTLDSLSKSLGASTGTRATLIETYTLLQEILLILTR